MSTLAPVYEERPSQAPVALFTATAPSSAVDVAQDIQEFYKELHTQPWQALSTKRFGDATSAIFALLNPSSTEQKRLLTAEEKFIERNNLKQGLELAYGCIKQVFGEAVSYDLEYGVEHGIKFIEWLDINIHFEASENEDVNTLLMKTEQLDELFDVEGGNEFVGLINFFPDIK